MGDPSAVVPHRLSDALVRRPLIEVAARRALVRFPGQGRILVPDDGPVVREPDPGRTVDDLCFLDDVVDALAGLLAGRFALRAAVVEVDGVAVALSGHTPAGKSTVAMALAQRGHRFVGDALATVTTTSGAPSVTCPQRGPVLWPDSVDRLGLDPADGEPVRASLPALRFGVPSGPASLPLSSIVVLRRAADEHLPRPASGLDAVAEILRACWHRFAVAPLGLDAAQFGWATRLAGRVRVATLEVPRRHADPHGLADAVLELAYEDRMPT